ISSPVFRAEVMDCKIQRDNSDARISEEEKETIRKKAFEQAKLKISEDFLKEKGILVEDLVWINLDVIKERIDGYLVKEIKKRKGRVVDVKVLAIFTPRMYLDRMKRTFEELELNAVKISHLAEIVSGFGDGIFLDVGGRLTKAFFIIDKALDDVRYFERGGYNFSSRISENFGLEDAAARQLKEDYSDGKLSPEARGKIKDIFAPERNAWKAETVDLKRAEIRGASIFFMGGGSLLREIRSVFNEKRIILPKNLKKIEFTNKDVAMLPQFVPSLLMALKNGEKNI
ncbi:MAG: hypothetical protein Q8N69_01905, partial [bacterium]|nr:hypothetical protein [bacterium]